MSVLIEFMQGDGLIQRFHSDIKSYKKDIGTILKRFEIDLDGTQISIIEKDSQLKYDVTLGNPRNVGHLPLDIIQAMYDNAVKWKDTPREIRINTDYLDLNLRNPYIKDYREEEVKIFVSKQDRINLLLKTLMQHESNFKEKFHIKQDAPGNPLVAYYLNKLATLIEEEDKKEGIDNLNDLKVRAHELCELPISLEEVESLSRNHQNYLKYLLAKDGYIVVSREEIELASAIVLIAKEFIPENIVIRNREFDYVYDNGVFVKGDHLLTSEPNKSGCRSIILKYLDYKVTDWSEVIESEGIDIEMGLINKPHHGCKDTTVACHVIVIDSTFSVVSDVFESLQKIKVVSEKQTDDFIKEQIVNLSKSRKELSKRLVKDKKQKT